MPTAKKTTEPSKNFLVIPASEMGWVNFPSTEGACVRTVEQALEQKLAGGWLFVTTIYRNVGHHKDKPFFIFKRVTSA